MRVGSKEGMISSNQSLKNCGQLGADTNRIQTQRLQTQRLLYYPKNHGAHLYTLYTVNCRTQLIIPTNYKVNKDRPCLNEWNFNFMIRYCVNYRQMRKVTRNHYIVHCCVKKITPKWSTNQKRLKWQWNINMQTCFFHFQQKSLYFNIISVLQGCSNLRVDISTLPPAHERLIWLEN